jgi:O-antigen ligase
MLALQIFISAMIILGMMLFYGKMPYLIMFGLFIFTGPSHLVKTFFILRWAVYAGFAIFGILYSQRFTLRKIIMPDAVLIGFISIVIFSYFGSIRPNLTLQRGIAAVLMYFAIFVGIYSYVDHMDKIRKILHCMLIYIIIYNLLSIIPGMIRVTAQGRLVGLSGYPGSTGALNVFMLPIALAIYLMSRRKIHLFCIIFILIIAYFSYARTAFIAMILSVILFYIQFARHKKAISAITILLAIGTTLVSFYLFGIWLPERLVRLETLPILGGRTEVWAAAREMIAKRPLRGFGFGTEEFLTRRFGYTFIRHVGGSVHNSFLGLALQIGVPATMIFFAIVFYFMISSIRFVILIEDRHVNLLGIALTTVLFAGFIYSFAESWIYSTGNPLCYIYYMTLMLLLRFKELVREKTSFIGET